MKGLFDNLRLRAKLLLMMFSLLLLTLASLFVLYWHAERTLVEQVEKHTMDLSTAIQISVERLTSQERTDEARLQDYVNRLQRKGVDEISIISNEEEVIASSNPRRVGATIDPSHRDLFITARLGETLKTEHGQKNYNLIVPIVVGNQRMGYALISMVLDDFAQISQLNFIKRLIVTVLVFGLGMAASLILSWKYTKPIDQVVQAARRVAQGDLRETLPVERHDEIGELTTSFNDMVIKLRANKELEHRLHQAERLSSIGQLASGIAHEIRNPLNFINLSIDHLQSRFLPTDSDSRKEFTHLVSWVKTEIHRLNTMITNFLTYGKPLKLEAHPSDLAPLLQDVVSMASGKAEEQGITIEHDPLVDLPRVVVDSEQIKTCFVNILVNAFQAMPSGGRLSITAAFINGPDRATSTPLAESGRWVEVRFQDTGCGISPEDLAKVFEPYFTTKEVGIGLGLALTKKIVEEHGGSIALDSVLDQGTTVRIRLPVEEQI
ncbi:MAG: HAMP domain-containing protein [bacterium]|uniref:histidine kinase n=1 Tax=Candidatus Methylomirabilis tolerans TaxID=3123416 RepID=A0AAJ1AIW4_9BACT|nr:HAMP domain-containing protein [Candidatus Methylomirabilis sp.]